VLAFWSLLFNRSNLLLLCSTTTLASTSTTTVQHNVVSSSYLGFHALGTGSNRGSREIGRWHSPSQKAPRVSLFVSITFVDSPKPSFKSRKRSEC